MNEDLMNKEVLCIFDTRQIQRYIFRSNSYYDILGASDLVNDILIEAIEYALKNIDTPLSGFEYDLSTDPDAACIPYFKSENIKFQLIICAAGNAMCIVRTGSLAQKIIRKISRYYLDNGCTLNIAASAVEKTDNMSADVFSLYKKLDTVKASADNCEPLGALSVVMKEHITGDPVIERDEQYGDHIAMTSKLKRRKLRDRRHDLGVEDTHTTKGEDGKDYLAVIHADGNNLGITISRILEKTADYEESIRIRRRISRNIMTLYDKVMEKTLAELRSYCVESCGSDTEFDREFLVIHQAGDDVNCICNASMAFPFIESFYKNLEGAYIWELETVKVPLYVCTGIAFVTPDSSFTSAFTLAESCCKSAKTEAKKEHNLKNGLAVNWIDFQVCDDPNSQELGMLRQRYYVTADNIRLFLRPYCMDTNQDSSYEMLKHKVLGLSQLELTKAQRSILRQSYVIGRMEFGHWVMSMEKNGIDLAAALGAPLYKDSESKLHAAWFDAVEISDFLR